MGVAYRGLGLGSGCVARVWIVCGFGYVRSAVVDGADGIYGRSVGRQLLPLIGC
jgi:hypothetical protein